MERSIIALCILLVSCSQSNVETKPITYKVGGNSTPVQVVTIDNCQYLYGPWGNATVFTHKGNCNNNFHHTP